MLEFHCYVQICFSFISVCPSIITPTLVISVWNHVGPYVLTRWVKCGMKIKEEDTHDTFSDSRTSVTFHSCSSEVYWGHMPFPSLSLSLSLTKLSKNPLYPSTGTFVMTIWYSSVSIDKNPTGKPLSHSEKVFFLPTTSFWLQIKDEHPTDTEGTSNR